jgi:ATP-dependent Clp protease ATP-binding subunit ClpB
LQKLIGVSDGSTGILAHMVSEHPYGVLLLDEFEKTTSDVMNVFLQILDEGFFSDSRGQRVNCRNVLIIATSNAGAELIWEQVKAGKDVAHAKDLVLDSIIHANIMKPELLNRFDGVIIFHPLGPDELKKIADLQLAKLKKRVAERGYNLIVTPELVSFITQAGTDPKFGARPMARAIQDTIEHIIAEKIIRGEVVRGGDLNISVKDLS